MTCCEFQRRLSAYLDGEVPRWTRWKIDLHVRSCSECAQELRDLAMVDEYLAASVERTPAPEYLTGAVMHRLPAMPPARRSARRWTPVMAATALAGAQLVALVGAYWVGFNRGSIQSSFFGHANGAARGVAAKPNPEPATVHPVSSVPANDEPAAPTRALFTRQKYPSASVDKVLDRDRRRQEREKLKRLNQAPKLQPLAPSSFPTAFQPQGAH
jgi:anti-sigma factor RsiW